MVCGTKQACQYSGTHICVDVYATVRACVHAPGVEAVASSTVVLGATAKSTGYFKGQVDEVSFWSYARTRAEVESDMFVPMSDCNMHWASTFYANGTMYPQTRMAFIDKPPTAYFAFNEGLGGEVSTFTCPVAYVDAFLSIDESGRLALDSSDEPTFGFTPIVPQTASGETVTGSLGLNGAAGSSPEFIPSSVPVLDKATVEERVPTLIHIPVSSEDGNEYGACLLESVGSGGQLYFKDAATQGVGEPIPYPLPYPVYLGGKEVYFLSDEVTGVDSIPDVASFLFFACDDQVFYGSDLSDRMMRPVMRSGDFYDTTVAPESTESSFAHQSYVKSFSISVQPLNIAPVACTVLEPCTLALSPEDTLTEVPLTIPAYDRNTRDVIMARITHTPREGYLLLPSGEVVEPGMFIAAEMRTGDNVNGGVKLTYMPKPHSTGFFADSFGYYVTDGQYRTEPMEFSFDIDATGIASRRSGFGGAVAGDSGSALSFSGMGQIAYIGDAIKYGVGAGTSFGMYFKTSKAMGAEAVLATVGPMSLKFDDLEDALTFHCGSSTKVSSKENFNDGLWHFVSASCNSSFAELMVDGKSYGTKATQHFPESTETCGDYEQTGAIFSRENPSQYSCPNLKTGGFCEHAAFGPLIRGLCSMSCGTCGKYYDDKEDMVAVWGTQNPSAPKSCAEAVGTSFAADSIFLYACSATLNPIKGPIALGNVATKTASGSYTAGSAYGFQGEIDEFVIRTGHTAAELSDTLYSKKAPLDVMMKGLFGYYRMNEPGGISLTNDAPALDLMLVANSAVLGTDGAITTTPTRTPSTVFDFGNIVHTLESTAKSVKLTGLSSLDMTAMITKLPKHGKITHGGKTVHSTTEIALGNLTTLSVEYIPNAHYSGSDSFTYVIIDSAGSSNPTKVAVTVEPMPNRPTASSSTIPVDFKEASDVAVALSGSDHSLPAQKLTFVVTFLPTHGTLHLADGSRVTAADMAVESTIFFRPSLNDATSDSFGYAVRNEDGMLSEEALVTLDGSGASVAPAQFETPVAGDAGFAIRIVGGQKAVFGSPSAYALDHEDGLKVTVAFKHNRDMHDAVLATIGPVEVGLSKAIGTYLRVGSGDAKLRHLATAEPVPTATAATYDTFNDGAWHTLTITISSSSIAIAVDGVAESIDVDASATLAAIEDEEIVVGGAGAYVDMDELKISGVGTSVRGYYKMNEKSGSALSNEITSVPCLAAHRHIVVPESAPAPCTTAPPAGTLGVNGTLAPERVTSTLTLPEKKVTMVEDSTAAIKLNGYASDLLDTPIMVIDVLPNVGKLHYTSAAGKSVSVTTAPFTLPSGIDIVHYTPAANGHSASPGATYATFSYATEHSVVAGVTSFSVSVAIVVDALPDVPVMKHPGHISILENEVAKFSLAGLGSTVESKELTYIVTALPLHGTLYANGVELTSPGEVIPAPYEMKYDPPLNVHGMPFDTLGFAVTDGEMQSEIQTMDVSIDGNSALDLNRMNGAAVKFYAFKPADLSGDFTVSAWVKLDAATTSDLSTTVFTLVDGVSSKLAMAAKTDADRYLTSLQWPIELYSVAPDGFSLTNDRWHHIAFVLSQSVESGISMNAGKHIFVDGLMVATAATLTTNAAPNPHRFGGDVLYIGGDASSNTTFPGLLDNVVIYSRALQHHEVVENMGARVPTDVTPELRSSVEAYLSFDETFMSTHNCQDMNLYTNQMLGASCDQLAAGSGTFSCSSAWTRGVCPVACSNCANWLNDKQDMIDFWRLYAPQFPKTCAETVDTAYEVDGIMLIACPATLQSRDVWSNTVKSHHETTRADAHAVFTDEVYAGMQVFATLKTDMPRIVKTHVPTTAGRAKADYVTAPLVPGYGAVGSAGYALKTTGDGVGMHYKMAGVSTCGACADFDESAVAELGAKCAPKVAEDPSKCESDATLRALCPLSCDAIANTCDTVFGQDSPEFASVIATKAGGADATCRDWLDTAKMSNDPLAAIACPATFGLCKLGGDMPSYTVELWFRTGHSESVMAGLIRFSGLRVYVDKASGLTAAIGEGHISSGSLNGFDTLNDGVWHHAAISVEYVPSIVNFPALNPGHYVMTMYVDGKVVTTGMGTYVTPRDDLVVGFDGFAGEVDNVAVHAGVVSDFTAARTDGYGSPFPSTMAAFFPFNNAATGHAPVDAVTLATAETPSIDQRYFVSSCPVGVPQLTTPEEMSIAVELMSSDGDGDRLVTTLVSLPATGYLTVPAILGSSVIDSVPYEIPMNMNTVVYHPPKDFNGVVTFSYVANDGYSESAEAVIALNVKPVNDVPIVTPKSMTVATNTPVVVDLAEMVTDADGETDHTFYISTLPETGHLHYYSPAGVVGEKIPTSDTILTSSKIVYVSGYNKVGGDAFSVKAMDAYTASREAEISLTIVEDKSGVLPVAGAAGRAIQFADGGEVPVALNVTAPPASYAMTFWFRSSMPTQSYTDIVSAYDASGAMIFKVSFSRVGTKVEFAGGAKATVMYLLNDGAWHELTVTSIGELIIDEFQQSGTVMSASASVSGEISFPGSVVFGAGSGHSLTAYVDELRVYDSAACDGACRAIHAASIVPELAPGLLLRESFDAFDGLMGLMGIDASAVIVTESSAPLSDYFVTAYEDRSATVSLIGLPAGDVHFEIVELPEHGYLVDATTGVKIQNVPFLLKGTSVTFVPDADVSAEMGFAYDCAHKTTMRRSNVQRVVLDVLAQNDVPVLDDVSDMTVENVATGFFTFSASDVDAGETLEVYLASFPSYGRVFFENGTEVTDLDTPLAMRTTGTDSLGSTRTLTSTIRYVPDADRSEPYCQDYSQTRFIFGAPCANLGPQSPRNFCKGDFGPLVSGLCPVTCGTCDRFFADKDDMLAVWKTQNPASPAKCADIDKKSKLNEDSIMQVGCPETIKSLFPFDIGPRGYQTVLSIVARDSSGLYSKVQSATINVVPSTKVAPRALGVSHLAGFAAKLDHGSHLVSNVANMTLTSGITIDLYIRTTLASPSGAVLVSKPGSYVLRFADSAVDGIEFVVMGSESTTVSSGSAPPTTGFATVKASCGLSTPCASLNDGAWHRITATFDSSSATASLFVDTAQMATSSFTQGAAAFGSINAGSGTQLYVGEESANGKTAHTYVGLVDELKIYSAPLKEVDITSSQGLVLSGTESNLFAYYTFNSHGMDEDESLKFDSSAAQGDATLYAKSISSTSGVEIVSSTCPVYMRQYSTHELEPIDIPLAGSLGTMRGASWFQPIEGESRVKCYITALPTSGTLTVGDAVVNYVPYEVGTLETMDLEVRYHPTAEASQVHTVRFSYAMMNSEEKAGEDAVVEVVVTHPNHPPSMDMLHRSAAAAPGLVTKVFFGASDVDGDELSYHITTLPMYGTVYEVKADGSLGKPVLGAGAVLPRPAIAYVADEVYLVGSATTLIVGVRASDGKLPSEESIIDLSFDESTMRPVAGGNGNAMHLPSSFTSAAPLTCTLPDGTIVPSDSPFTASVWFKTMQPIDTVAGSTLVTFGPFAIGWEKRFGLSAFVTSGKVVTNEAASGKAFNDGLWHQATLVFASDRSLDFYVDGARVKSTTVDEATIKQFAFFEKFEVGKGFAGTMEQLVFVKRALTDADISGVLNMAINPRETDLPLALLLTFNADSFDGTNYPRTIHVPLSGVNATASTTTTCALADKAEVHFVRSTAPLIPEPFVTNRDTGVVVRLQSEDSQLFTDEHPILVTSLPSTGKLYQTMAGPDGEPVPDWGSPIEHVPTVTNYMWSIFYTPANETTSEQAPYLFTTLGYAVFDTKFGVYSPEAAAHVAVRQCLYCRNAHPTMVPLEVKYSTYAPVSIDITVSDLDGDVLEYKITSLPAFGMLYELTPTGDKVMLTSGQVVVSPKSVMYVPTELGPVPNYPYPESLDTYFGYKILQYTSEVGSGVADGGRDLMYDRIVKLSGDVRDANATHIPHGGEAGFALLFDGYGHAVVPDVSIAETDAGFTVEAWVKAPGGLTGSAKIVSTDKFTLRLDRVFGCTFHVKMGNLDFTVSNSDSHVYNDALWHFFEASYDLTTARVRVDGVEVASRVEPMDGMFSLSGDVTIGNRFFGMIDSVAIRVGASEHSRMVGGTTSPVDSTAAATALYMPFNDPSSRTGTVSYVSGTGVVAQFVRPIQSEQMRGPYFVASSAPLSGGIVTLEDEPVLYQLAAGAISYDATLAASDVKPLVTKLPDSGKLYQVNDDLSRGVEIVKGYTAPTHSQNLVMYVPTLNTYNVGEYKPGDAEYKPVMGAAAANTIEYVAYDSKNGKTSRESVVDITVISVYDKPVVEHVPKTVSMYQNEEVVVRFVAKAFETANASIAFKQMPRYVQLYPSDAKGNKLDSLPLRIEEGGMVVYSGEYLLMVPILNMGGDPLDTVEMFAYDGVVMSDASYTTAVKVTINKAVVIADSSDVIVDAADVISKMGESYTVSFWMRSQTKATASQQRRSLQSTPYQEGVLPNNAVRYPEFVVPTAYPESMSLANSVLTKKGTPPRDVMDTMWHHVAATYDGSVKKLFVDGRLALPQGIFKGTEVMAPGYNASDPSEVTIGTARNVVNRMLRIKPDGSVEVGGSYFQGDIDELRVYSYPQEVDEIRKLMEEAYAPEPHPESLVYYRSFDELASGTVQVFMPVAGENGFALNFDGTFEMTSAPAQSIAFNATYTATVWVNVPSSSAEAAKNMGIMGIKSVFAVGLNSESKLEATAYGRVAGSSVTATSNMEIADGAWHQIALTFNGDGTLNLFVDGELLTSSTATASLLPAMPSSGSELVVGGSGNSVYTDSKFVGSVDELFLYSTAVTPVVILTRYIASQDDYPSRVINEKGRSDREGLVAHYRFNSAFGGSATDDIGGVTLTGGKDDGWIISTVPVTRAVAGVESICVPLFGASQDHNVIEFYIVGVPDGGKLYTTDDDCVTPKDLFDPATPDGVLQFAPSSMGGAQLPKLMFVPDSTATVQRPLTAVTYIVSNGHSYSKPYSLPVSVIGANTAPTANDMTLELYEDDSVTFDLDAFDPQGSFITAAITGPMFGTLESAYAFTIDGKYIIYSNVDTGKVTITYKPSKDFNGADEFTYVVNDPEGLTSNTATVTFNVIPVEDCPSVTLTEGGVQTIYETVERITTLMATDPDRFESSVAENTITMSVDVGFLTLDADKAQAASSQFFKGGTDVQLLAEQIGLVKSVTITDTDYAMNEKMSRLRYVRQSITESDYADAMRVEVFCKDGDGATYISSTEVLSIVVPSADSSVTNARFEEDGQAIVVSMKSAPAADASCPSLLASETISKLGTSPTCTSEGTAVTITPGPFATLVPGDDLVFVDGKRAQIATPVYPVIPQGNLQTPSVVGKCSDMVLSAAQTFGTLGRSLTHFWSFDDDPRMATEIRQLRYSASVEVGPIFRAKPGSGIGEVPLKTTITARVGGHNFVNAFIPVEIVTSLSIADTLAPTVTVYGRDVISLAPTQPLHIRAVVEEPKYCPGEFESSADVALSWVDVLSGASLGTGPVLHLPAGTITTTRGGKSIQAVARRGDLQSEDVVTVKPLAGKVVAAINGAAGSSTVDWQVNAKLVLDASSSYDEEAVRGYNPTSDGWTFAYACRTPSGGACGQSFDGSGGASMEMAAFAMTPGTYVFTLTVTVADGRSSSAELTVNYVDVADMSMFNLVGGLHKAVHDDNLYVTAELPFGAPGIFDYEWTIEPSSDSSSMCQSIFMPECKTAGGTTAVASTAVLTPLKGQVKGGENPEAPDLYLDKKALLPGAYKVTLKATINRGSVSRVSAASTIVVVDTPPIVKVVAAVDALSDMAPASTYSGSGTVSVTGTSASGSVVREVLDGLGMAADLVSANGEAAVNDPLSGIQLDFGYFTAAGAFVSLTVAGDVAANSFKVPASASAYGVRATNRHGSTGFAQIAIPYIASIGFGNGLGGVADVMSSVSNDIVSLNDVKDYDAGVALAQVAAVALNSVEAASGFEIFVSRRQLVSSTTLVARLLNPTFPMKSALAVAEITSNPKALDATARADTKRFLDTAIGTKIDYDVAQILVDVTANLLISIESTNAPFTESDYSYAGTTLYGTMLDRLMLGVTSADDKFPTGVVLSLTSESLSLYGTKVGSATLESEGFQIGNFVLPKGMKNDGVNAGASASETSIAAKYAGEDLYLVGKMFVPTKFNPYEWWFKPNAAFASTAQIAGLKVFSSETKARRQQEVGGFLEAAVVPSSDAPVKVTLTRMSKLEETNEAFCIGYNTAEKRFMTDFATTVGTSQEGMATECMVARLTDYTTYDAVPPSPPPPPSPPLPPAPPIQVEEKIDPLPIVLGVLAGFIVLAIAAALLYYKRARDAAMERMIAAAEDQEVLEVQGLFDPSAKVAPIRGPVAGAQRTSAILESDVL